MHRIPLLLCLCGAALAGGVLRKPLQQFEQLERYLSDDRDVKDLRALEEAWRKCLAAYSVDARFDGWERIVAEVARLSGSRRRLTSFVEQTRARAVAEPGRAAELAESANESVVAFADGLSRSLGLIGEILARAPTPRDPEARAALAEFRALAGADGGAEPTALEQRVRDIKEETENVAVRARIVLSPVEDEIDGWGLAATEVQVKLIGQRKAERGLEDVPWPVAEDTVVRFERRRCRTDPAETRIPGGDFGASVLLFSEASGGDVSLSAFVPEFEESETVRVRVRFPWVSLMLLGIGLLVGALLRPNLVRAVARKQEERTLRAFLVDALAGAAMVVLLVAGVAPLLSDTLPAVSPRGGGAMKLAMGILGGMLGIPGLSAQLKKWLAKLGPSAPA